MPVSTVIIGGIGTPGLTSVSNRPSSSPPRSFTAPISVIASAAAEPPVVSRSTTTKVTSDERRPEVVERRLARGAEGSGNGRFETGHHGREPGRERGSVRHGSESVVEQAFARTYVRSR